MRMYGQDTRPLWDDAFTWEGSWLSFQHIKRLLIRTSRSITPEETEYGDGLGYPEHPNEALQPEDEELTLVHQRQEEDTVVRQWLVFPPPSLAEFQIWTNAFKGHANGERRAVWMPIYNEYMDRDQWQQVRDHPFEVEEVRDIDGTFA